MTTTAETTTLVTVKKTSGTSNAVRIDTTSKLTTVRSLLTGKKLMSINDSFLVSANTAVDREDEADTPASEVIKDSVMMIGLASDSGSIGGNDGVSRYNLLNDAQKQAIFSNIEVFRGLTFARDTFGKSFKDIYSWAPGYMPSANNPRVITELLSSFSFNKVTSEVKTFSSDSTSVNFSSPYASGEAEFKNEKSKTTTSSKVKEFLLTKYIVRKVDLKTDSSRMVVSPAFVAAVKGAVKGKEKTLDGYYNLIAVLNEYGYYVPLEFTLGGAILGTDSTEVKEFSEAESEQKEFNASFKAEFEKIGGGAAYSNASGTDKTTTKSSKYQNITMQLIGGEPGLEKDYPKWAESLKPAINWSMADVTKFMPSLLLLAQDDEGRGLLGSAINLLEKFGTTGNTAKLQPFIDMGAYNTTMQVVLNPFAD